MRKNRADLTSPLPTTAFRALPSSIHYAAFGTLGSYSPFAAIRAKGRLANFSVFGSVGDVEANVI
jgi:hypothetical protein